MDARRRTIAVIPCYPCWCGAVDPFEAEAVAINGDSVDIRHLAPDGSECIEPVPRAWIEDLGDIWEGMEE